MCPRSSNGVRHCHAYMPRKHHYGPGGPLSVTGGIRSVDRAAILYLRRGEARLEAATHFVDAPQHVAGEGDASIELLDLGERLDMLLMLPKVSPMKL